MKIPKDIFYQLPGNSYIKNELTFMAKSIPALGFNSYYVKKTHTGRPNFYKAKPVTSTTIGNNFINVHFGPDGFLTKIDLDGRTINIKQEFLYYEERPYFSGAYAFSPRSPNAISFGNKISLEVIKGPAVQEVYQRINDWVSQVVRVYKYSKYVEFEWMVGPINIEDNEGKDIISRFTTNISSYGTFYTDSNARRLLKRKRNDRSFWNVGNQMEQISGNYFPVTAMIALQDSLNRMAILTDRSQGGSSIFDGSLELLIHRRTLTDDGFGLDEPLNETDSNGRGIVVRGKHFLILGRPNNKNQMFLEKKIQKIATMSPLPFFSPLNNTFYEWSQNYKARYSMLRSDLQFPVTLLTLEPWIPNHKLLIRFEHNLEDSEPISFNIQDLFIHLNITDIVETTLDGNEILGSYKRLDFLVKNDKFGNFQKEPALESKQFDIVLKSMEIKTFLITGIFSEI